MLDRKYLRRVGMYVLAVIGCAAIAAYIGYHLYKSVQREIETTPAVLETFSLSDTFDAYIFRNEIAIGDIGGTAIPSVSDGEKVTRGASVAGVYSSASQESIARLSLVREQQALLGAKLGASSANTAKELREALISLKGSTKNGRLSAAASLSANVTAISAKRDVAGADSEALAASLAAEEQSILASFGGFGGNVYAPISGWYFSSCDGYENVFTESAALSLTPDGLDALINTPAADTSRNAGRIVCTYKWYAAIVMSSEDAARFAIGDSIDASIAELSLELEMTVEVISGSRDRYVLVLSCGSIPEGIDIGRRVELELCMSEITGFKLPRDAVRMIGNQTGVFVFEGATVSFRKIEILDEYDDYYIAAPPDYFEDSDTDEPEDTAEISDGDGSGRNDYFALKQNDMVVTKGKDLYHQKTIG